MSTPEQRAYQRGYCAAHSGRWPAHRPPSPPVAVIAEWMTAAQKLRDQIDSLCASWDASDPVAKEFDPTISVYDEAAKRLTAWLKSQP